MLHWKVCTIIFVMAGLMLGTTGCDSSPTETDPPDELEPTLSSIQQNIFGPTCGVSGCHGATQPQEGMRLTAGQSHASLVGVASNQVPDLMRVEPGDPDNSYLIIKLEGSNRIAPGTMRMPAIGSPLSQSSINVIREWIAEGAQNN